MKLRYGEGSIEQRGASFRAKWYGTDGKRLTRTFATEEAAAAHLLEVSGRKRRQQYRDPSSVTVEEAFDDWLERNERHWRTHTRDGYEARIRKHVLPRFGARRVGDLETVEVQRWVDSLPLAPMTVKGIHQALSSMLSECVRLGVIAHNPAADVRLPRVRRTERVVWSGAEIRKVLAYVKRDLRWSAVYHLALSTGMRPGELRAVMWDDIDFERGVVTVRRTAIRAGGRMVAQEMTKSGDVRHLTVPESCLAVLSAWREHSRSPYIMSKRYATLLSDATWRQWHEAMCEEAGVRVIGLHGIRHSVATAMLAQGVDVKIVSERLGHSSTSFTMDIYQHVDLDMQRAAVRALSGLFED